MSATKWVVRCPDFSKSFQTRAAAERWLARVVEFGHCRREHVLEISRNPAETLESELTGSGN